MDAPQTLQKRAPGVRSSCPQGKECRVSERTAGGAREIVGAERSGRTADTISSDGTLDGETGAGVLACLCSVGSLNTGAVSRAAK